MYVHRILHHWACILISNGSLHRVWLLVRVRTWAFWDPIFFVFTLSYLFESEMSDLFLGTLGHCPFLHYFHYWCDFTPCLTWVDCHFCSCILWTRIFHVRPHSIGETCFLFVKNWFLKKKLESPLILFLFLKGK